MERSPPRTENVHRFLTFLVDGFSYAWALVTAWSPRVGEFFLLQVFFDPDAERERTLWVARRYLTGQDAREVRVSTINPSLRQLPTFPVPRSPQPQSQAFFSKNILFDDLLELNFTPSETMLYLPIISSLSHST